MAGAMVPHSEPAADPATSACSATTTAARRRRSEPQRDAVAARIGAAEHRAVAKADRVRLAGAREEFGRRLDRVALADGGRHPPARHPALEVDRLRRLAGQEGADEETRPFDRFLRIEPVVEQ